MEMNCFICGEKCPEPKRFGRRTIIYCSARCRHRAAGIKQNEKRHNVYRSVGKPIIGDVLLCKHPLCDTTFVKTGTRQFCSANCAQDFRIKSKSPYGFGDRCAVYFRKCMDCGVLVTNSYRGKSKNCASCAALRLRAVNARKNHKRRTSGALQMSVIDLVKRDGSRCHLCFKKINISLNGSSKWGPTIDHILPVSFGGTNEASNLALAHRVCNVSRGNRQPAQMLLIA